VSDDPEKPWDSIDKPDGSGANRRRLIEAARRRVEGVAVALMAVGGINACLGLLIVTLSLIRGMNLGEQEAVIGAIACLGGGTVVAGGNKLRRMENLRLARTAAIVAMIPCVSPCLILGLPVGVWALTVANSPEVIRGFEALRRQREEL
jgi:hypothetical protein